MKKIRFLRPFTASQRVGLSGSDLLLNDGEKKHLIARPEESVFIAGEKVDLQPLTIEERRHILVGNIDMRLGAILDDAVEGTDFERID